MLGPEQVNLGPRAIPQTFASLPSLQISNDAYRGLALSASQVVTGVIALEHGRLYLRANSGGEPIRLPLQYLKWLGREVQFQGSPTSSQIVRLTPVTSTLTSSSSHGTGGGFGLTQTPCTIIFGWLQTGLTHLPSFKTDGFLHVILTHFFLTIL